VHDQHASGLHAESPELLDQHGLIYRFRHPSSPSARSDSLTRPVPAAERQDVLVRGRGSRPTPAPFNRTDPMRAPHYGGDAPRGR
jgi:hypothetical protein